MITWEEYKKKSRYPHMGAEDAVLWNKFIDKFPELFTQVAYDVRVGDGTPPAPDTPESYAKMQLDLSKKRIDVVGLERNRATIIEVKPYAALSAIGQVEVYADLFRRDEPRYFSPRKLIICQSHDPDITLSCRTRNIEVVIV